MSSARPLNRRTSFSDADHWKYSTCWATRLIELGATPIEPVAEVGEGIKVAAVQDPFGNRLCFVDEKTIFTGEWYFRPSVIEVDYNQGMVFEGLEGELERVRWEVRGGELVAYRSYE